MNEIYQLIEPVQSLMFENLILPVMHIMELTDMADEAFDAIGDILLGLFILLITYAVLRPLEAFYPAEKWSDRRFVREDIVYTILMRSGILPLMFFFILDPIFTRIESGMHMSGIFSIHIEDVFPALHEHGLIALIGYIVIIDFLEYIRHRMQHRFAWWWGLHCIHHSQRQLSLWSDERNHVLDSLIKAAWLSSVAIMIGVPGGQFIAIVILIKLVENLSHANVSFDFGRIFGKVLVSPAYHRLHHAMGIGHNGKRHGCNFATLFPVWDILFRTAVFDNKPLPTGISDQLDGVDYGNGFLKQQWIGLRRMLNTGRIR